MVKFQPSDDTSADSVSPAVVGSQDQYQGKSVILTHNIDGYLAKQLSWQSKTSWGHHSLKAQSGITDEAEKLIETLVSMQNLKPSQIEKRLKQETQIDDVACIDFDKVGKGRQAPLVQSDWNLVPILSVKAHGVLKNGFSKIMSKALCRINHLFRLPLFILLFFQVVQAEAFSQMKCFHTVTHYYGHPEFSGGKSFLTCVYKNDKFHTVSFDLSCVGISEGQYIMLESIQLSLPADEDEFCMDSKHTNYTKCSDDSQCECCEAPKNKCSVPIEDIEDSQKECNYQENCTISITSQFLNMCEGRKYECNNKKCHSRWAEVFYSCIQRESITKHEDIIDITITTQATADEGFNMSWWQILLIVISINLMAINVCLLRPKKSKCFPWVKTTGLDNITLNIKNKRTETELSQVVSDDREAEMTKTADECKETTIMIVSKSASEESGVDMNGEIIPAQECKHTGGMI